VIAEDARQLLDVSEVRHVVERQRAVGQERGDHQRQCGVLGAGDRDRPVEFVSADDPDAIHALFLCRLAGLPRSLPKPVRLARQPVAINHVVGETGAMRRRRSSVPAPPAFARLVPVGLPRQPVGARIRLARPARAGLRLAPLQVGPQPLGQPRLLLVLAALLSAGRIVVRWRHAS